MTRVSCLSTGRCGSMTFTRSFSHATSFSAGHETLAKEIGPARFDYPDQHVESDNRLTWFLGDLDRRYGDEPIYVHLQRDPSEVARSYSTRHFSEALIMRAFGGGILRSLPARDTDGWLEVASMYVSTVTANIEFFLRDKKRKVEMHLEDPIPSLARIWEMAEMEGDYEAASL